MLNNPLHKCSAWPPGTIMSFDNTFLVASLLKEWGSNLGVKRHRAVGIVVANDGIDTITVVWGANCKNQITTYSVAALNLANIHRVS